MYNTIHAEDSGKPSLALVAKGFVPDAKSAASSKGMPSLRILASGVPAEATEKRIVDAGISSVINDIIAALTKPVTAEEKALQYKLPPLPRIVYTGDLKGVNEFFYKKGWMDGLPIIPPTEEAVAEMLTGTDLPKDLVVAKMIPRLGKVTVEIIAVNAVMAGALPTYMPVLIAAVKALQIPDARFGTTSVSTASWAPFWVINGPIRNDIGINCSQGAMSPGNIANATIGRAMGLIIKNAGGIRQGIEDMGVYGNPGKYSMVVGENEEESPWEPLSVEYGFQEGDNTLALAFPTAMAWSMLGGQQNESEAQRVLNGICRGLWRSGTTTIMISPQHAQAVAEAGYSKQKALDYIVANVADASLKGRLNPKDFPNEVKILVAGGYGGLGVNISVSGGGSLGSQRAVQKIDLPANWAELVAKYKDLKPTYDPY